MMLSLGYIFRALLLFTNALAILHEKRFLVKVGLSEDRARIEAGLRLQLVNLLRAFRVLRFPIMVCNAVTIVVLVVMG